MTDRIKCNRCDHMILEVTAKVNNGLCGHCKRDHDRAAFDRIVDGWRQNPETLPGTHGIREPDDMSLKFAASQLRAELDPTPDDRIEAMCHQFFDQAHTKWSRSGSSLLSTKEKHVLAVETFYGEVTNGGIQQYLGNESGAFANWSVDAFKAIGIPEYAEVMRRIKKLFPGESIPEESSARWDLVESIDENVIEEIENDFWNRYSSDESEIRKKLYEYIKG